jgi:F-box/leucine-rich repeat protein 10/11
MENKVIKKAPFKKMKGSELDSWLEDDPDGAMKEPVIIEKPDGLGMKMPPEGLTIERVAEYVGESVPLEVIGASSISGPDSCSHSNP